MSYLIRLFEQIRRRRVVQILLVYAGAAWVLAEASQFLVENYDYSRKLLDTVVYLLVVGFPAAVVIAWYHGERGPQRPTLTESALLSILAVIGLSGAYQIASRPELDEPPLEEAVIDLGSASVAIIPFDNQIADPELAWLGQGLAELLTTGLAQLDALRVVSGQRLYDLLRQEGRQGAEAIPNDLAMRLSRRAGARYMVRGTVLGSQDDITLNASLIDLRSGVVAAASRARGSDAFAVVDQVSAELSGQILAAATERRGRSATLLAAELAPVSQITTGDIEAYRAYQEGLQAERRFRRQEARAHYERAIQLDPGFALAHARLAGREMDAGNSSAAIRELFLARQLLRAAPERDRLLIDGLIATLQDNRDSARAIFRELLDQHPDDKEGRYWLWQLSEGDEKQRLIEEAIRLDPYYATAYNYLAYHMAQQDDFAAADSAVLRYAELEPGEPNPLDSRGEIYEFSGEPDKARVAYRTALQIEPTFVYSLDHLTRTYLREGKAVEARSELESFLPGASPDVTARLRLLIGDTHAFEGSFEEAILHYIESAEIGIPTQRPDLRIQGLNSAAWLQLFTGRYEEAEQTSSILYGIDPFSETALMVALKAGGEQGRIEEIEGFVADVLRVLQETEAVRELGLGQYTPEVLQALVRYYGGDTSYLVDAFDRLKPQVDAEPDLFVMWEEVQAHLALGNGRRALALAKSREEQIRWEGRYMVLENLRSVYEAGRAHELLGETAEAAAAYERLVAQLGDALEEIPRMRDTRDRLARLSAAPPSN
ncbi:MAG: hypothetical protein JSV95_03015 [Gemmatimonadota bacterium]|nr:MAG: hypothetical protein JSV95_03015 [Gemmatimonadota bacterium]